MRFYGEDGVAAISIILYLQYIFTALYFGYANGIAPIISYKYGNGDKEQLRDIFWNSILFLAVSALSANVLIHFVMSGIVSVFVPVTSRVFDIVMYGVSFYQIAFVIMGFAIFASSLFTAFSDGKSSAIISFSRTFVFVVGAILLLPVILGEAGAWLAVPIAEFFGLLVAFYFLIRKRTLFGLQ